MYRFRATILSLFLLCSPAWAIELRGLVSIGPMKSFSRTAGAVTFTCQDNSEIRISVLAPDLFRVRAAFGKALPEKDHSWAIEKTSWDSTLWTLSERPDAVVLATTEAEIIVERKTMLIQFRDPKAGRIINADFRPLMFDPKGSTVAAAKRLGFYEHFYGLGEKAARLDKRRGQFEMWNSDTPAYTEGRDPIYQSIPFYIGLENGAAYGIFFDNSYRTHFDFGATSQQYAAFSADGGEMNYYFFWGPSIKKILQRYTELTGRMPLPPLWALGNQQSRWGYYPDTMAEEVVRRYRQDDLPLDVLHLDIDYMNGYRIFTWDTNRFPDPKAFTDKLKGQGVKVVTIVDPGIKYQPPTAGAKDAAAHPETAPQERSYYVFNQGMEKNFFLKRKNNQLYIGRVWPGESVFVDFTLADARTWWGDLFRAYLETGVSGIWTDMNEPADFVDQTGKTQMDVVSYDDGEFSTQAKNRNVFALLMARATREGLERLAPDQRPFIITRAGYAGVQRYATMWTGDNTSTWNSLALSIPMFETLGLSGEPFVGADIGGFIGRADGELLTRWYQVGFMTPFCRNHKDISGYDQEPWRFARYYEDIIRKYLKLRYRLLPYLYGVLEEAHRTGVPYFRPLLLDYQNDANAINIDDEFMVGHDLLLAPVLQPGLVGRLVYLPEGEWFDYWSATKYKGGTMFRVDAPLEKVPMFVRAGAIIPLWPEMNYVGEKPADPVTFELYPDAKAEAGITLYEDDGLSRDYLRGVLKRTAVTSTRTSTDTVIKISAPAGSYRTPPRDFVFVVKSVLSAQHVSLDGHPLPAVDPQTKNRGWFNSREGLTVRIADDGGAHEIAIR